MTCSHRGFALLAVLWLVTALAVLSSLALEVARVGLEASNNRILLARAEWAREACIDILLGRFSRNGVITQLDSVDLGRSTWCGADVRDAGDRLNANFASPDLLRKAIGAVLPDTDQRDSVFRAIVDRRTGAPLVDDSELASLPCSDSLSAARLAVVLTTRGLGKVNVNAASPHVLGLLPGMTEAAIDAVVRRRSSGHDVQNLDDLAAELAEQPREILLAASSELRAGATFVPAAFVARVHGSVGRTPIRARVTLMLIPEGRRLAVVRRETE